MHCRHFGGMVLTTHIDQFSFKHPIYVPLDSSVVIHSSPLYLSLLSSLNGGEQSDNRIIISVLLIRFSDSMRQVPFE